MRYDELLTTLSQWLTALPEWQQLGMLVPLGAIPFVESHTSSLLGVVAGINPVLAISAGVLGNLLCTYLLIFLTGRARRTVTASREPGPATARQRKISRNLNRFGVPGVSLLGPLVMASQVTAPTLVALGAARRRVYLWMGISILTWGVAFGLFGQALAQLIR